GSERRQFDPLRFEVAVEDEEQPIDAKLGAILTGVKLVAQRSRTLVLPARIAQVRRKPRQVRHAILVQVLAEEELPSLKTRETASERDRSSKELYEVVVTRRRGPVEPTGFVVLAVCVVVTPL